MESNNIRISLHRHAVPPFVDTQMEQLYQNMYASPRYHRVYGGLPSDTNTYVASADDRLLEIFLFRVENNEARVINEQIHVDTHEVQRFAQYVFDNFNEVHFISFHAVQTPAGKLPYPSQRFNCTEDIVLRLPADPQEYRASLGKSTRNYVSRYQNKLKRDFPALRCDVFENEDINEEHVRAIIALNRARMAGRNRESYMDDLETERTIALARLCGMVTVMTLEGRVCAGTINYRIGNNYFLKAVAHDPAFNDYGLGTLCCYRTICECIARGGNEYHFLWGRYEYKYRLLGIQCDLAHLTLYRSKLTMLRHGRLVLRNTYTARTLQMRDWLLQQAKLPHGLGPLLRRGAQWMHQLRSIRQTVRQLLARKPHTAPLIQQGGKNNI